MLSTQYYNVPNLQSLDALAQALAPCCRPGLIITLSGGLGAGKTTFVQALLRALGIQGLVKSPTFTLVEVYDTPDFPIYHFDLYRLEDESELDLIGFRDYLADHSLCLIEWPEKAPYHLKQIDWAITITPKEGQREISLTADKKWHIPSHFATISA